MTIALLIIDLQAGNFAGSNPIFQGDLLLDNTQKILQIARSSEVKVIYIQNMGRRGDPDEPGSDGWQIHPMIKPLRTELIIEKSTPDSFYKTKLDDLLKSTNVNEVVILGLQTEYCIDTAVRRAYSLGYNVILVKDCHSTWHSKDLSALQIINHHNSILGGFFADLSSTDEVIQMLQPSSLISGTRTA